MERPSDPTLPCVKDDYEMAVATETAGLEMTVTSVICPVLWAAGVRVEAMATTLMALHPNFWKILELTDPFTQGKWSILFWKFEQILSGILFQFLQPRSMDTKRELFSKIPIFWVCADRLGRIFLGHFGYFRQNYNTHLGTVSPWFWLFECFFYKKPLVFRPKTYKSQINPKYDVKVHIFWEGHKILQNLPLTFDRMYCSQKLGEDFAKFCGLLRIYEL